MNKAAILIIALSARPFAQAAKQAGYSVTVIDGFADMQTLECADAVINVPFDAFGLNAQALLEAISSLDSRAFAGCVYGSGFDAQPMLLEAISERIPLIGNLPETVSAVKSMAFFDALQSLAIPHPHTFKIWPGHIPGRYLKKSVIGCGGTHITISTVRDKLAANEYYQQHIEGQAISLLFLAHNHTIEVIGFNEQWVSASPEQPFRYGGAVSNIDLPDEVQQQLTQAAQALTVKFNLAGLNSLDAMVKDRVVYVLEINPRLSATFDLYDAGLLNRHLLAADLKHQLKSKPESQSRPHLIGTSQVAVDTKISKAHAIVYASKDLPLPSSYTWPKWATDIPTFQYATMLIESGEPICTVLASAQDAESAKQLVMARVKLLEFALDNIRNINTLNDK